MSNVPSRRSAQTFPPSEFIADELAARGWSTRDLAERMGGDVRANHLAIDLLMNAPQKGMFIGAAMAGQLEKAFGVSWEFFLNLDEIWQLT